MVNIPTFELITYMNGIAEISISNGQNNGNFCYERNGSEVLIQIYIRMYLMLNYAYKQ